MKIELKKKIDEIYADMVVIDKDDIACNCNKNKRKALLISSNKLVNTKKDIILYWCECGFLTRLNDNYKKNRDIYSISIF